MKSIFQVVVCVSLISAAGLLTVNAQTRAFCLGEWSFRCPDATDGYDTGIIRIDFDSIITEYPGLKYSYYSNRVECCGDCLCFDIKINGQIMNCTVKITGNGNLSGDLERNGTLFPIVLVKADQSSLSSPDFLPPLLLSRDNL